MKPDDIVEGAARHVAARINRRRFLGRVGGSLVAVGAGGLALQRPDLERTATQVRLTADAIPDAGCCGCSTCGESAQCANNACPSGSCDCGYWTVCACGGGTTLQHIQDCCAACSGGCGCSGGRPTCYYNVEWSSGCSGHTKIHCRVFKCVSTPC